MYYFLIHPLLPWIPASSRLGSGSARRIRKLKAWEGEIKTCPLRLAPSLLPSGAREAFTISNRPADPDNKNVRQSSGGALLAERGSTIKGNPELNLFRRDKSASRIAITAKLRWMTFFATTRYVGGGWTFSYRLKDLLPTKPMCK
jgi:hypothetical protein